MRKDSMSRYELFRLDEEAPAWVGTAETLEDANVQASRLAEGPECLILDRETGHKIVIRAGKHNKLP